MAGFKTVWTSKHISTETKLNIIRTCVMSVLLYACETWTLMKKDKDSLLASEMKCYRRILHNAHTMAAENHKRGDKNTCRKREEYWWMDCHTQSANCQQYQLTLIDQMGSKLPPRPIFSTPFRHRMQYTGVLWWLFLNMAWLQNGVKFSLLPPSGTGIWRPEPGSRPGILVIFLVQAVTRVRIDIPTQFQLLYPCLHVWRIQWS